MSNDIKCQMTSNVKWHQIKKCHEISRVMKCQMSWNVMKCKMSRHVMKCQISWNAKCHEISNVMKCQMLWNVKYHEMLMLKLDIWPRDDICHKHHKQHLCKIIIPQVKVHFVDYWGKFFKFWKCASVNLFTNMMSELDWELFPGSQLGVWVEGSGRGIV